MKFYQMGGFRSHTNRWQTSPLREYFLYANELSRTLFPPDTPPPPCLANQDGDLELTLGIRENGASYLLLDEVRFNDLLRHLKIPNREWPRDRPQYSEEYISLSPIVFTSHIALSDKLRSLQPKGNKKKRPGDDIHDVSRANERFGLEGNRERALAIGRARAAFESSRIVSRIAHTLHPLPLYLRGDWQGNIGGILTLSFSLWGDPPVPLDVGWSRMVVPGHKSEGRDTKSVEVVETVHIKDPSNALLMKSGDSYSENQAAEFKHGESVSGTDSDFAARVKRIFHDIEVSHRSNPSEPFMLILHDSRSTLGALRAFGIDTSTWESMDELIRGPQTNASRDYDRNRSSSYRRDDNSRRQHGGRHERRSRSPPPRRDSYSSRYSRESSTFSSRDGYASRGHSTRDRDDRDDQQHPGYGSDRSRLFHTASPPPAGQTPTASSIYIADVQSLFAALADRTDAFSFRELCMRLGITTRKEGWCAGNDARYLYDVWQSLVGGSSIDDRAKEYDQWREKKVQDDQQAKAAASKLKKSELKDKAKMKAASTQSASIFDGGEAPGLHGSSLGSSPALGTAGGLSRANGSSGNASRRQATVTAWVEDWEDVSDEDVSSSQSEDDDDDDDD